MPSRPATLPPQDNATTALYRAALGPVGATYYLRVFGRFDEAGLPGPAWNTMAACFTLGWLIYRRLWGAAFSYAVLMAALVAALWFDIGPWSAWPDEGRWAAGAALAAGLWLLPGFYANVLLHGELRRRMTEAVREAATVQGLTHLIARVLMAMEPLPTRMTTASFDRLMQAVDMVRHDSPAVFRAIERDNPFAAEVRERFFALADEARGGVD